MYYKNYRVFCFAALQLLYTCRYCLCTTIMSYYRIRVSHIQCKYSIEYIVEYILALTANAIYTR